MLRGGWGAFWALPAAALNVLFNSSNLLSLLFLAPLLSFFSLIFDLGKVLQNAGCRLFAFLLILDQLVDPCSQIGLRLVGLTGLGGPWFFSARLSVVSVLSLASLPSDVLAFVLAGP